MARYTSVSGLLSLLALCVAAAPIGAQTVTAGRSGDAAGVSKVDAITIKQTTVAGYMKLGDIKGEATAPGHAGHIEILSWSWGESRASGRSRPASGPGTLTITKAVDTISPDLADASRNRRGIDAVTVELRQPDGSGPATVVTLEAVVISSVQRSRTGDAPTETVTLAFQRIR